MNRRTLLAAVTATAFSTAALTGAVAATTHVFAAGEAAAGVGTISPVSTTTLPPIVEHKIIDVEDPAVAPAAPASPPATAPAARRPSAPASVTAPAPAVATVSAASVTDDQHHDEGEVEDEPGDD